MTQFTYDLCLLYKLDINLSSVVEMQIDDILLLADQSFVALKKETIKSAKIMIKNRERLTSDNSLKFNETRIERLSSNDLNNQNEMNDSNEVIYFRQETHIQGIQLINSIESSSITSAREKVRINLNLRKQYIVQRARGVYLAAICQFEATFDLFRVAQSIDVCSDDIIILNKRLK
jgi:TolA-binding protein